MDRNIARIANIDTSGAVEFSLEELKEFMRSSFKPRPLYPTPIDPRIHKLINDNFSKLIEQESGDKWS
jgi:hypothetical protein